VLRNERASAGNDGIGGGCTTLEGRSTPIECDATGRKSPQQDRSHKLCVKQMGARSAGNPHATCDVEGTGNVARSRGLPARQSSTLPTWRGLETWHVEPARQSSTLPMSGMWKRSYGRTSKAPPNERGGKQICSNLKPPRHISTLPLAPF
jgi:hypothetical protein